MTGIDQSLLQKSVKKRGLEKALNLSIAEIQTFKSGSFDTILMLGNNFGLLGNFKRAKRLLKIMHRITSPHAMIIAESNDPYQTYKPEHLHYQKFNRERGRMVGQLRIRVRFKKYMSRWFDYLLVSQTEMKEILEGTGWKMKQFIYSDNSDYIGILEKY